MSTKVKGGAIKEGSIPLSALADDVKDKIENAGADWNALENEPGYIKNKPSIGLEKVFNGYTSIINIEPDDIEDYVIQDDFWYYTPNYVSIPDFTEADSIKILGLPSDETEDYTILYADKEYFTAGNRYNENAITLKYYPQTQTMYIYYGGDDVLKFDYEYYKNHGTPIKTTPQILTDNDKNQALTNLGIDPVVWKYICKPYIFNGSGFSNEGAIPSELMENGKLKYKIPAMYRINISNNYRDPNSGDLINFMDIENQYGEYTPAYVDDNNLYTTYLNYDCVVEINITPTGTWTIQITV